MKEYKVKKSYTLDPDVVEGVKKLAEMEGRNESQMANRILKKRLMINKSETIKTK
jgi:hypothetical protein